MASIDTFQVLAERSEWIAPRSDLRVFLGEPGAPEATKTTVEPGNSFSPGMRSCGVTWWLRFPDNVIGDDAFFAPEMAPVEALHWSYEQGYLPVIHCDTEVAGLDIQHSIFQDGTAADRSEAVCGRLRLINTRSDEARVQVFLALRSLGPAGGPIPALVVDDDGRGFGAASHRPSLLRVDHTPDAAGCGVGDPSPLARAGQIPSGHDAHDVDGWCFGLLRYDLSLPSGETWQLHVDCPLQTQGNLHDELPTMAVPHPEAYDARVATHLSHWQERLASVILDVPDPHFRDAFFAGLQHMLTAMVGDQARIAPLCYPLPWLRDSVYIIRSLDLAGLHNIARAATAYCARNDFFGGFGAEGDAPGQGIWALTQHYRLARDRPWLQSVYPDIRRKCDWLFRMRRAEQPIQVTVDTPVLAFTQAERASGVICLAARDGLIMGAMDHGVIHALGWVNQWALCGLREAAYAAHELGCEDEAGRYRDEADALWSSLRAYAAHTPSFFSHERTVTSLLWPTGAWDTAWDNARQGFDAWWVEHRGSGDVYRPEPYWLYFEFAQAHNALLFGERERAWQVVDYRLRHQDLPGLYGWREGGDGVGTENAIHGVTLINQLRGCQRLASITPHGWSQAEMWLLQRAMLVDEWGDGLLLLAGVPAHWLTPRARIAFSGLPTWYGHVNVEVLVDPRGEAATVMISGIATGTPLTVRLPGHDRTTVSAGRATSVRVDLVGGVRSNKKGDETCSSA